MIELSLGPLWSRALIRLMYMLTSELTVRVPALNMACIFAIVISSISENGPVWKTDLGVVDIVGAFVCGASEGMLPRSVVAPAAAAAAPALYLRKSLLVTFLGGFSGSMMEDSTILVTPISKEGVWLLVELLTVSDWCLPKTVGFVIGWSRVFDPGVLPRVRGK